MRDLAEIQAGDALVQLKRDPLFTRSFYLSLSEEAGSRRRYAARFLDKYQVERMSPAGWRVLDAYLVADR